MPPLSRTSRREVEMRADREAQANRPSRMEDQNRPFKIREKDSEAAPLSVKNETIHPVTEVSTLM